jgi:hypothetical protein
MRLDREDLTVSTVTPHLVLEPADHFTLRPQPSCWNQGKVMRSVIEAVLVFAMVVSGGAMTVAQPRNTPAVSGSLISVAALKKLKRRYTLLAH